MKIKKILSMLLITILVLPLFATNVFASELQYLCYQNGGIADYYGPGGVVEIPESINGIVVKDIYTSTFGSSGVTEVVFPESLENISRFAFINNNVTVITIPANVSIVDNSVGNNASSFYSIYMLNGQLAGRYEFNGVTWDFSTGVLSTAEFISLVKSEPTKENLKLTWNNIYELDEGTDKEAYFDEMLELDHDFKNAYDSVVKAKETVQKNDILTAVPLVQSMDIDVLYREVYKDEINALILDYNNNVGSNKYLTKAIYYTQKAEEFPTAFYVRIADSNVFQLNDGPVKTNLQLRLDSLSTNLSITSDYIGNKLATNYVELSEIYGHQKLIDKAQALINNLKDLSLKESLQTRLNNL